MPGLKTSHDGWSREDGWHWYEKDGQYRAEEEFVYIIRVPKKKKRAKWHLVDTKDAYQKAVLNPHVMWVDLIEDGDGTVIAGPFDTLKVAKVAFLMMFGRT